MTQQIKYLSNNIFYRISAEIVARVSMFFFYLTIAQLMGVDGYGSFMTVFSFLVFFTIINDFGINIIFARNVSQNIELFGVYFSKVLRIKLWLLIIFIVVCWFSSQFMPWTESEKDLIWALIFYLGTYNFLDTMLASLWAMDLQKIESRIKIANKITSALTGIIILYIYKSLFLAISIGTLSHLIFMVIAYFQIRRAKATLPTSTYPHHLIILDFLKEAFPVTLVGFFTLIYTRTDIIMLKIMRGDVYEIGLYSAVIKVTDVMNQIPAILMMSTFPLANRLFTNDKIKFSLLMNKLLKWVLIYALIISIGGFFFANQIFPFLFGSSFSGSTEYAVIFFWAFIPMGLNLILLTCSVIAGRQFWNMVIIFISLLVNVFLNITFIPEYGAIGACFATLITEFVLFIGAISIIYSQNIFKISYLNIPYLIFPFILFTGILFYFSNGNFLLIGLPAVIILLLTLYLFNGISKEEKEVIRDLLKQR